MLVENNIMPDTIFIISQILSIIGCSLFAISCKAKTQKRMLIIQTVECCITATVNALLNGITGCIITAIAGVRNAFGIFRKNGKVLTTICIVSVFVCSVLTYSSWWDILPLAATICYSVCLSFQNITLSKIGIIINSACWAIYDFSIGAYVYVIFNCINIGICVFEVKRKKCVLPI